MNGERLSAAVLIPRLQRSIGAVLRPLLVGADAVALVGFPNYPNVGDSAIWLGTLAYLRANDAAPLRYVCDYATYSRERLAQRIGKGVILLQGGGNLGDLWEVHERFRAEVVEAFPQNPIVQLPQSIHFRKPAALAQARTVFDRHPRLTLLVREQRSLTIARDAFRTPSILCPDMAFALGALRRPAAATQEILWLARTDQEAAPTARVPSAAAVDPIDWLTERAPLLVLMRRLRSRRLVALPGLGWLRAALPRTYEWAAQQRLRRGCAALSAGRVVVTDRLHGHILCLLLGIPHVLLDNSYGKVRSFYETWTGDCALTRWGDNGSDAWQSARELAGRSG